MLVVLAGCGGERAEAHSTGAQTEETVVSEPEVPESSVPESNVPATEDRPEVESFPAECDGEPSGLALRLACAGGGRPFLDELVRRCGRNLGPGRSRLETLATRMPDVRAGDALSTSAADALQTIVQTHLVAMCSRDSDTSRVEAFVADWSGSDPAQRGALRTLLVQENVHFNASNGLLGWLVTLSSLERLEYTRAQAARDFSMASIDSDRGLATQLGARLADIVIALTSSPGNEEAVEELLFGAP